DPSRSQSAKLEKGDTDSNGKQRGTSRKSGPTGGGKRGSSFQRICSEAESNAKVQYQSHSKGIQRR
ncbi:hypothetical protein A2U01_0089427, partial [Trifolium medium]|nr:hypothetical protein [Trifolium medium]